MTTESSMQSALISERRAHEAFAASRRRVYVEQPELFGALDAVADAVDGPRGLVVTGVRGAGKSALLANWSERRRARGGSEWVLEHYVGASSASTGLFDLIRRVLGEIRERYGLPDPVPASLEALEEEVPFWLARAHGDTLILIIDAVDQLRDTGRALAWVPTFIPPSVRIIISTRTGVLDEELTGRGWPALDVPPLSRTSRATIASQYLADTGAEVPAEQLRRLTAAGPAANPLFLQTSLAEANAMGSTAEPSGRVDRFLEATTLDALMDRVLDSLEEDLGVDIVSSALALIACSRGGLTAGELGELIGIDAESRQMLVGRAAHHLMQRDDCYQFANEAFRDSAETRYVDAHEGARADVHRRLGEYFTRASNARRRAFEAPWQWLHAGDRDRLFKLVVDPSIVVHLAGDTLGTDLMEYWATLGVTDRLVAATLDSLSTFEETAGSNSERSTALAAVGTHFAALGRYDDAAGLLERALALVQESGGSAEERVRLHRVLGELNHSRGSVAVAEAHLRNAIAGARDDERLRASEGLRAQRELAFVMHTSRRYADALTLLDEAWHTASTGRASMRPILVQLAGDRAAIELALKGADEAAAQADRALQLSSRTFGDAHPDTATALNNVGAILLAGGRVADAIEYFDRARDSWSRLLGSKHPHVGKVLTNLGLALKREGRSKEAMRAYEQAIEIDRVAGLTATVGYATKLTNCALLLRNLGDLEAAERLFTEALAIYLDTFGPDHLDSVQCEMEIARLHFLGGAVDDALQRYKLLVPKKAAILGVDHPGMVLTMQAYQEVLAAAAAPGSKVPSPKGRGATRRPPKPPSEH